MSQHPDNRVPVLVGLGVCSWGGPFGSDEPRLQNDIGGHFSAEFGSIP